MGTVTPTVVPGEGYVRVEVNWQDMPHARRCWIYRVVGGVATTLRDGDQAVLSNGIAVAYDHEAPLDTPVTYRSTVQLNWNGSFEDGVAEWADTTNTGTLGTVSQSFDYYAEGRASLKLTPTSGGSYRAVSEMVPVVAGQSYTFTAKLMMPSDWPSGVGTALYWYNGTTFLSGNGPTFLPVAPGVWTDFIRTNTAPASATQARLVLIPGGSPQASLPLYADAVYMSGPGTTVDAAPVLVPSAGGGWWTDPLHPATKVRLQVELAELAASAPPAGVVYLGVGDEQFPASAVAMDINDAPYSVTAFALRKAGRQNIRIGTATLADRDAVLALHASGAPLLLQLDTRWGEAAAYHQYGDLTIGRIHGDQKVPWRIGAADFTKVLPPVGPAEGTNRTRYVDLAKYPTFSAASAAGVTWLDALRGNLAA